MIGETPQYGARHLRAALELPLSDEDLLREYWARRTEYMCRKVDPAEGLLELLDLLQAAGVPMAVASNSPCDYVTAILHALKLDDYFACVFSSEDVAHGKPAPDVYLAALDCLGVEPERALVLEDSPAGLAAAKAAGVTCFAIPNADMPDADFSAADQIFNSITAVKAEFQSQRER